MAHEIPIRCIQNPDGPVSEDEHSLPGYDLEETSPVEVECGETSITIQCEMMDPEVEMEYSSSDDLFIQNFIDNIGKDIPLDFGLLDSLNRDWSKSPLPLEYPFDDIGTSPLPVLFGEVQIHEPSLRTVYKSGYDHESEPMEIVDPSEVNSVLYKPKAATTNPSSLLHDHSYSASSSPAPEEHESTEVFIQNKSVTIKSEPDVEENSITVPAEVTIPLSETIIPPVKHRGRPKKTPASTKKHVKSLPRIKATKRFVATSRAKKSKVPIPASRSRHNSKQMSNDKREQHNRAERERRNELKNNLTVLQNCINDINKSVLINVDNAMTYVKRTLNEEIENDLSAQVASRLDYMSKYNISGENQRKSPSKVTVIQGGIYLIKDFTSKLDKLGKGIDHYEREFKTSDHLHNMNMEKKLNVQNTSSFSRHKQYQRKGVVRVV